MREKVSRQPGLARQGRCSVLLLLVLALVACHDQEERVAVRRADAQRAAALAVSRVEDRTSPFGYQTQIEGMGEAGPVVRAIDVTPSYRLDAFGGQLMGDDRGEFGGELMFRDRQGVTHQLMKKNVHGIFDMPFGVIVFTGLAHMQSNVGAIYLVVPSSVSVPVVKPFQMLQGAPVEVVRTLTGELMFKVFNGRFERNDAGNKEMAKDCYLMKKGGEIRKQSCTSIAIID